MIVCSECGKPITTREFWYKRYYEKKEYVCERCACSQLDAHMPFNLMLTTIDAEVKDGKNVQTA